jgi:hypothetical protein
MDLEALKEKLKEKYKDAEEYWKNYKKEFKTENDIPSIPVYEKEFMDTVVCPKLIECGAIPKDKLVVGHTYLGDCRNAHKAIWKDNGRFEYTRTKFGYTYLEEINHFQDYTEYDIFIPIKDLTYSHD